LADSAIWLGEVAWVRDGGVRDCDPNILAQSTPDGLILLHEGDNLGDLWPKTPAPPRARDQGLSPARDRAADAVHDPRIERQRVPGTFIEAGCAFGGAALVITAAKRTERAFNVYDVFGMIRPLGCRQAVHGYFADKTDQYQWRRRARLNLVRQ
jgi:hypothetical protein